MRDAIILIFANKQDLPEGKPYLLDMTRLALLSRSKISWKYSAAIVYFIFDSSNETPWDPREVGAHAP